MSEQAEVAEERHASWLELALYLLTSVFAGLAGRAPLRWYLGWVLPSTVVAVLAGVLGHLMPGWSLAVVAWGVLVWFGSYDRLVKR